MFDGALILTLDDDTAARLAERARELGLTSEQLAALILNARFFDYDTFSWIDDDADEVAPDGRRLNETGRSWSGVGPPGAPS